MKMDPFTRKAHEWDAFHKAVLWCRDTGGWAHVIETQTGKVGAVPGSPADVEKVGAHILRTVFLQPVVPGVAIAVTAENSY